MQPGSENPRDIGTVVHHESRTRFGTQLRDLFDLFKYSPIEEFLMPKLYDPSASIEHLRGGIRNTQTVFRNRPGVKYRIKTWNQIQLLGIKKTSTY